MGKILSFTYDETATRYTNEYDLFKNIYDKFNLRFYDVIEFSISNITYQCSIHFALEKIRTFGMPELNYHKIISKNEPPKS